MALLAADPAVAQMRPLVLSDARLLTGDGTRIARGSVMIVGDTITAVGPDVSGGFLARTVDLKRHYITPGLIDLHTTLGLDDAAGGASATGRAIDSFDRFARERFEAAWRAGITAVYVPARGGEGLTGRGAVVRLAADAGVAELALDGDAALCVQLAGGSPIARVLAVEELRKRFKAAKDYREAWEDYEEDLEEYEEKLAERAKKAAEAEKAEGDKTVESKPKSRKSKKKPESKPADDKAGDESKDKEADKIEKPAEPAKDPVLELLLRVLDGELRLRVEAHTPADILNVLDLVEETHAAAVIEGATGAHHVADRLAALEVPVVLSGPLEHVHFDAGIAQFASPDAAARLHAADVPVYFGSGVLDVEQAPSVLLRAARAAGHGYPIDETFQRLTHEAAKLLGVDDEIGVLAPGHKADLVVWNANPLAPGARVVRVYVGGVEVYRAD